MVAGIWLVKQGKSCPVTASCINSIKVNSAENNSVRLRWSSSHAWLFQAMPAGRQQQLTAMCLSKSATLVTQWQKGLWLCHPTDVVIMHDLHTVQMFCLVVG